MIDFSQLRQSGFAKGDPITEALDFIAKKRAREEEQERELAFKREDLAERTKTNQRYLTTAANNRARDEAKQDLAERRFVGDQTVRNSRNEAALNDQVRGDIANRDYGRAQQRSDSYSYPDPETGEVKKGLPGFKVDRGTRPEMPESPVEYGPQATPEISEEAAIIRAGQNAKPTGESGDGGEGMGVGGGDVVGEFKKAEDERKRFAQQNTAPKDVAMALYQRQAEAYGRKQPDQPVTGEGMDADGNIGPAEIAPGSRERPDITIAGVPTNPDDLRYSAGRAEAEDFKRIGSVLQAQFEQAVQTRDPQTQAAAQRKMEIFAQLAPQVETGRVPAAKAMQALMGATTAENQRAAALEQTVLRGGQARERAVIGADAAAARNTENNATRRESLSNTDDKTEVSRVSRIDQKVSQFARQYSLGPDRQQRSTMRDLISGADSNPITQRSLANMLMRVRAGERGVTTDKDRDFLIGKLEGIGGVDNAISMLATGQMTDAHLKIVKDAALQGLAANEQREAAAKKAYAVGLVNNPTFERWGLTDHVLSAADEMFGPGGADEISALAASLRSQRARPSRNARPDPSDPDDANGPGASAPLNPDEAPASPKPGADPVEAELRRRGLIR